MLFVLCVQFDPVGCDHVVDVVVRDEHDGFFWYLFGGVVQDVVGLGGDLLGGFIVGYVICL